MNDQEILKTFEVKLENNIILVKFLSNISDKIGNIRVAELVTSQVYKIIDANPSKKYNIILDLLDLGNQGTSVRKARETYAEVIKKDQINKIAVVGGSVVMKTIASFIMSLTNKEDKFKFFNDKQEAINWINNE